MMRPAQTSYARTAHANTSYSGTWFSTIAFWALCVFVFSIPSERAILIPGFGTISKLFGFVAVGVGFLAVLLERRIRVPSAFHKMLAVFMLWSAFTLNWTVGPNESEMRANTYLQLFVMIMLVWQFSPNQRRVNILLASYVLGTLVNVADTIRIFAFNIKMTPQYYQRYTSTGTEPNDLSVTLALSVPASYYLWLYCRDHWKGTRWQWLQWLFPFQIVAVCVNVLLGASRGGSLAMLVALTIIFWTGDALTRRMRWNLLAIACVGALLVAAFVPMSTWTRLATAGSQVSEGNLNGRTELWAEGWKVFTRHPFQGVGVGAYPDALAPVYAWHGNFRPVAHNTFFSILVETGVIGFALFAFVLATLISCAARMPSPQKKVWLLTLAVWAVGIFSLSWEDRKPMWFIFAITAAQAAVFERKRFSSAPETDSQASAVPFAPRWEVAP